MIGFLALRQILIYILVTTALFQRLYFYRESALGFKASEKTIFTQDRTFIANVGDVFLFAHF